jgi:hypothetical protein
MIPHQSGADFKGKLSRRDAGRLRQRVCESGLLRRTNLSARRRLGEDGNDADPRDSTLHGVVFHEMKMAPLPVKEGLW